MPLVINVVASEDSNLIRDALTSPTPNSAIDAAFQYVERGDMGGRSRTALNGGWAGVLSVARRADGTAEAQRTWALTDAQMASSSLTNDAAVIAFAQRLAADVHASLRQRASRNRGGQIGDFWTVVATPSRPGVPTVAQQPATSSNGVLWFVGAVVAVGVAAAVYSGRK
jgi:hypothetical protein